MCVSVQKGTLKFGEKDEYAKINTELLSKCFDYVPEENSIRRFN